MHLVHSMQCQIVQFFGLGEHFNVELLERGGSALGFTHGHEPSIDMENLRWEEERQLFSTLTQHLDEKMSFVQMLRGVESPSFIDPNFQFLLRLQQQQQNQKKPETDSRNQALELESCISIDISEAQSPIKSESKDLHHPQSSCPGVEMEVVSSACKVETNSPEKCREWKAGSSSGWRVEQNRRRTKGKSPQSNKAGPAASSRERRKRKRTRPSKNKEEVESQRLTHIAVERNRRRQMADHLNALRSLMPTSFIQRGDQASIISGAIDFVKELEQLLQSLDARKRMSKSESEGNRHHSKESTIPANGFFASTQWTMIDSSSSATVHLSVAGSSVDDDAKQVNEYMGEEEEGRGGDEGVEKLKVENKAVVADIEVIVTETHVKLKIVSARRRSGQLVRAIAALEDLRLNILHLNITSSRHSVLYSFNLKMEDECKLGSADDIATAVHQSFRVINPA